MSADYRALSVRAGTSGGGRLHLIRDDSEASLCGLPRATLGPGTALGQLVCQTCVEWLPRRVDTDQVAARSTDRDLGRPRLREGDEDEPWLSIRWDALHKSVYAEWKGLADSAEFRSGTLRILKEIRNRHAAALISDNRRLEVIANQDQLWINESWVPMAVASGLRRIAVVLAPQGLGKIASEAIIGRFGDATFETRTFESPEEAIAWIAKSAEPED